MNCILFSGGLFQIYSNIKENYLSYEDLSDKISKLFLPKFPNIKTISQNYKNINNLEK